VEEGGGAAHGPTVDDQRAAVMQAAMRVNFLLALGGRLRNSCRPWPTVSDG